MLIIITFSENVKLSNNLMLVLSSSIKESHMCIKKAKIFFDYFFIFLVFLLEMESTGGGKGLC